MVKFSACNIKTIIISSVVALFALSYIGLGYLWHQNQLLTQEIINSRKVYVYDLQKVLLSTNLVETKQQYEQDIVKLNNELLAAEKKIKTLKDAKVKEDFSTVYFSNLRLKRDELVSQYEKNVQETTNKINAALSEIAKQQNISTIFVSDMIVVKTPYIIDVTNEVIEKIHQ